MNRSVLTSLGVTVTALVAPAACSIEPIDLNDRACDEEHPCVDGYECIEEVCELEEAEDDEEDDDDDDG